MCAGVTEWGEHSGGHDERGRPAVKANRSENGASFKGPCLRVKIKRQPVALTKQSLFNLYLGRPFPQALCKIP